MRLVITCESCTYYKVNKAGGAFYFRYPPKLVMLKYTLDSLRPSIRITDPACGEFKRREDEDL
jgi:hypothetical protein